MEANRPILIRLLCYIWRTHHASLTPQQDLEEKVYWTVIQQMNWVLCTRMWRPEKYLYNSDVSFANGELRHAMVTQA